MYTVIRGWIDTADRCRTWIVVKDGRRIVECSVKREALALAAMLNNR
jgi:hypothetical protein